MNGWADLALAYGTVQVPMWIGMAKARAQFRHFVLAPTIAAPLLAVSAAVSGASGALFHGIGMANPAAAQWLMGAALGAALGYVAGRAPVRSAQEHIRGTVVEPARRRAKQRTALPARNI